MEKVYGKVLVIDDDPDVLLSAKMVLKRRFEHVRTTNNPEHVIRRLEKEQYDVLLMDMNFTTGATSGKEGFDLLARVLETCPGIRVIMMTAYGEIEMAVEAMKQGATDFVVKPWDNAKLVQAVICACQTPAVPIAKTVIGDPINGVVQKSDAPPFAGMMGQSLAMKKVFNTIEKVARTDANVLILGENGTGKELVARAIHQHSPRQDKVFVKVDLGSLPETLFESELFGHKKGAFTDAREDRAGRFEIANEGSVFLDEIGNLSMPMQSKLLTVLQGREVTRIGSNKAVPIDIRLICATNMPLYEMVGERSFRQDLLYRINTVEIRLPSLRERKEDVPELITHFLAVYANKYQREGLKVSDDAMDYLKGYHWPGNIRELQHAVERAVIMSDSDILAKEDFWLDDESIPTSINMDSTDSLNLVDMERVAIKNAILKHNGNISKAAKELGVGRTTLYRRMEKYGL